MHDYRAHNVQTLLLNNSHGPTLGAGLETPRRRFFPALAAPGVALGGVRKAARKASRRAARAASLFSTSPLVPSPVTRRKCKSAVAILASS